VLGLDHVDSPPELMIEGNTDLNALGPGDREGCASSGKGRICGGRDSGALWFQAPVWNWASTARN
jgi:hypothetical protein